MEANPEWRIPGSIPKNKKDWVDVMSKLRRILAWALTINMVFGNVPLETFAMADENEPVVEQAAETVQEEPVIEVKEEPAPAPKQEAPQPEAPKQEEPKQEAPKQEEPQQESSEQEAPQQESSEQEAPQQESSEQEEPQQEASDQEVSEQESSDQEEPQQEASDQKVSEQEALPQEVPEQQEKKIAPQAEAIVNPMDEVHTVPMSVGDEADADLSSLIELNVTADQMIAVVVDAPVTLNVQKKGDINVASYAHVSGKVEAMFTVSSGSWELTFSSDQNVGSFRVSVLDAVKYLTGKSKTSDAKKKQQKETPTENNDQSAEVTAPAASETETSEILSQNTENATIENNENVENKATEEETKVESYEGQLSGEESVTETVTEVNDSTETPAETEQVDAQDAQADQNAEVQSTPETEADDLTTEEKSAEEKTTEVTNEEDGAKDAVSEVKEEVKEETSDQDENLEQNSDENAVQEEVTESKETEEAKEEPAEEKTGEEEATDTKESKEEPTDENVGGEDTTEPEKTEETTEGEVTEEGAAEGEGTEGEVTEGENAESDAEGELTEGEGEVEGELTEGEEAEGEIPELVIMPVNITEYDGSEELYHQLFGLGEELPKAKLMKSAPKKSLRFGAPESTETDVPQHGKHAGYRFMFLTPVDTTVAESYHVDLTLPQTINMLGGEYENARGFQINVEAYHIAYKGLIPIAEPVQNLTYTAEGGILSALSFDTAAFGPYIIKYEVEFTYGAYEQEPEKPEEPAEEKVYTYTFNGIGESQLLSFILSANEIFVSIGTDKEGNSLVSADETLIAIDENLYVETRAYFEETILTVTDTEGIEYKIILHNPEPTVAPEPVVINYEFKSETDSVLLSDVLGADYTIASASTESTDIVLSQREEDGAYLVTAKGYFEKAAVTVTTTDNKTVTVIFTNPVPAPAPVELKYTFPSETTSVLLSTVLGTEYTITEATTEATTAIELAKQEQEPVDYLVTALGNFDEAVVTVTTADEKTVIVTFSNPAPVTIDYYFDLADGSVLLSTVLGEGYTIVGAATESNDKISLTEQEGDYLVTALGYFDEATVTVTIAENQILKVIFHNPIPTIEIAEEAVSAEFVDLSTAANELGIVPGKTEEKRVNDDGEEYTVYKNTGYFGLDIKVDEAALIEGFRYSVSVTLPEPINLTGEENTKIENADLSLYHIVEGQSVESGKIDIASKDIRDNFLYGFTFVTDSFSPYLVTYTVDFTYVDEQGNVHTYSFPGRGDYPLTEILEALEIVDYETIENATLELTETVGEKDIDEEGLDALYMDGDAETGYMLHSHAAFDDIYTLTVLIDGFEHVIMVTDESSATFSLTLLEKDGISVDTAASSIGYNYIAYTKNHGNTRVAVGPINVSNGIASATINAEIPDGELDNGGSFWLINWESNELLTIEVLRSIWDYDPLQRLKNDGKKQINSGTDIGLYVIDYLDGSDGAYEGTAIKKDVYTVNLHFINNVTDFDPVTPGQDGADPIKDPTYVGMHVYDPNSTTPDTPIGYAIAKMPVAASTNTVVFDTFKTLNGQNQNLSYADIKRNGYIIRDVAVKHYTGTQQIQNTPSYNEFMGSAWTTDASDGYTFVTRAYDPGALGNKDVTTEQNTCTVYQRLADPTEYSVKLDLGGQPIEGLEGYKIYAKVNVNDGSRFGFVEVTPGAGATEVTGVVTKWYNADDTEADKQKINGHENNVSVTLHALTDDVVVTTPSQLTTVNYPNPKNKLEIGDVLQSHKIVSYPSIPKDYDPEEDTAHQNDPQRIIGEKTNEHGKVITYTDVVYLKKPSETLPSSRLEDLLAKYNVIALCPNDPNPDGQVWSTGLTFGNGDFYMGCHTMGAVLVHGDLVMWGQPNNIGKAKESTWPSAVGGLLPEYSGTIGGGSPHNPPINVDFYVGSDNTVVGSYINGTNAYAPYNAYGKVIVDDEYVPWTELTNNVQSTSNGMINSSSRTITVNNGDTVVIDAGEHVKLHFTGDGSNTRVVVKRDPAVTKKWSEAKGTVISIDNGGIAKIPQLRLSDDPINGSNPYEPSNETGDQENGAGMSVVFNYPYATNVSLAMGGSHYGHVVAPNAMLYMDYQYNGCLVANAVRTSGDAEGHVWPYKGGKLVTSAEGFAAQKTVNDALPTAGQVYEFTLEELKWVSGDTFSWQVIETKQNNGQRVAFTQINYSVPPVDGHYIEKETERVGGTERIKSVTYYYRITENPLSVTDGCNPDLTQYYIKVVVNVKYDGENIKVTDTTVYHKQAFSGDASYKPNPTTPAEIDGLPECDDNDVRFNNTTSMMKLYKSFTFDGEAVDVSKLTEEQKKALKFTITTEMDIYQKVEGETQKITGTKYVAWAEDGGIHGRRAMLQEAESSFTYADFRDGMLVLEGLPLGDYTVVEEGGENVFGNGYIWNKATVKVGRDGTLKPYTNLLPGTGVTTDAELVSEDFTQIFFVNEYVGVPTSVKAIKIWDDEENKYGLRDSVKLRLEGYYLEDETNPESKKYVTDTGDVQYVKEVKKTDTIVYAKTETVEGKAVTTYITETDYNALSDTEKAEYTQAQVAVWDDLPMYVHGHKVVYKVYEMTGAEGYTTTEGECTYNEDTNTWEATLTNKLNLGALQLSKTMFLDNAKITEDTDTTEGKVYWNREFYVTVEYTDKNGATWYLTRDNGLVAKTATTTDADEMLTIKPSDAAASNLFTDLPFGDYIVTEYVKAVNGETTTYKKVSDSATVAAEKNIGAIRFLDDLSRTEDTATIDAVYDETAETPEAAEASLVNTYVSGKYCIAVTKQWLVNGEVKADNDLVLYVKLQRTVKDPTAQTTVDADWEDVDNIYLGVDDHLGNEVTSTDPKGIVSNETAQKVIKLTKDNNWSAVAVGMDQMDKDGLRYSYRWVETDENGTALYKAGERYNFSATDGEKKYYIVGNTVTVQSTNAENPGASAGTNPETVGLIFITKLYNSRVDFEIPVKKTVTGNPYSDNEEFTVSLTEVTEPAENKNPQLISDDEGMKLTPGATIKIKRNETGRFVIEDASKPGTYNFVITETAGTTAGMTYDTAEKTVTVVVKWNDPEKLDYLVIDSITADDTNPIEIKNKYSHITYTPHVNKIVEGVGAPELTYKFTLTDTSSDTLKSNETLGATTVAIVGTGSGEFGEITYTDAGV